MSTTAPQLRSLLVQRGYKLSRSTGCGGVERQARHWKRRMRWPCALNGIDDDEIETGGD